jgi:hypothetical protein
MVFGISVSDHVVPISKSSNARRLTCRTLLAWCAGRGAGAASVRGWCLRLPACSGPGREQAVHRRRHHDAEIGVSWASTVENVSALVADGAGIDGSPLPVRCPPIGISGPAARGAVLADPLRYLGPLALPMTSVEDPRLGNGRQRRAEETARGGAAHARDTRRAA